MLMFSPRRSQWSPAPSSLSRNRRFKRQSTVEPLEGRTLLSYTFTGGGTTTGTATGDGNADTLYLEPFGGLIYHSTDGTVFSPDWGGGLTIAASAANTINVNQGNVANAHAVDLGGIVGPASGLAAKINVNDGGALDSLLVDDSTDAQQAIGASAYTITSLTVAGPPTLNVHMTGPALGAGVTLLGGTQNNTFNVTSTFIGEPNKLVGNVGSDTFNVLGTSGALTIDGHGNTDLVNIGNGDTTGINGLVTVGNSAGHVSLVVDASGDTVSHNISLTGGATTSTLSNLSPAPITYTTAQLEALTIDTGQAGNQVLNVDFSSGNPIPTATTEGLIFNAGAGAASAQGSHALNLQGTLPSGAFTSEVHNANDPAVLPPNGQYGSILFVDSSSTATGISYTGLQPINDTAAATTYTFNDFADDESFTAQNGPTVLGFNTIQFENTPVDPAAPPTFETTNIANKANVVFNTTTVTAGVTGIVNITTPSTGLATLAFNTPTGQDNVVSFVHTPAGVKTSLLGGSDEDVTNVTGAGVAAGTTLALNGGAGINTLNYDAGGKTPTITAGVLPGEVKITVPGAGTVDALNYQSISLTNLAPIVVTPGAAVAIKGVEGVPLVNQIVATFTAPILTPLAPSGFPASAFTASLDWGDPSVDPAAGTITQDASNPSVYYVTGTHTFVDNGTYTVASKVDFMGGTYSATINGVVVTSTFLAGAPVTGTPATATVIQSSLNVSASPIVGTEGIAIPAAPIATFVDTGGADLIGNYSATIKITNSAGVVVVSVPAASITQNGNAAQYTVNAPAITLPEAGTYQVLVSVTDSDGTTPLTAAGSSTAIIADATLSASATQPTVSQTEPALFPVPQFGKPAFSGPAGSFTDANPTAPVADFTATIDWGDGSSSHGAVGQPGGVGTAFIVSGAHTYADAGVNGGKGTYAIQVFVTDVDGSKLTIANTATVTDNPIVLAGQLNPASDSGLSTGTPDVTNVKQPDFYGTSEAFSHVTLYATLSGGAPVQIGQVQAGSDGAWNIKSGVALADGHYQITASAVDQFGVTTTTTPTVITSNLLIDTHGPVITGVFFNRLNGQVDYTIQDPGIASGGAPAGVWVNSLLDSSNYLFTKVHAAKAYPGKWVVTNVAANPDPMLPNAYDVAVTLNGGAIIQGGFYLFTIRDSSSGKASVQDLAENHLDGEFYGSFPSGNGINGGDFVAELQAVHNKVFAPQTIVGTANAGNTGNGGLPVAPIHSGIWVPAVPVGGAPIFSTSTSPTTAVGAATRKVKTAVVVTAKPKATVVTPKTKVPAGPLHKK